MGKKGLTIGAAFVNINYFQLDEKYWSMDEESVIYGYSWKPAQSRIRLIVTGNPPTS